MDIDGNKMNLMGRFGELDRNKNNLIGTWV